VSDLPYQVRGWHPSLASPPRSELSFLRDYATLAGATRKFESLRDAGLAAAVLERRSEDGLVKLVVVLSWHPAELMAQKLGRFLRGLGR
jgi:hypothetical protein